MFLQVQLRMKYAARRLTGQN